MTRLDLLIKLSQAYPIFRVFDRKFCQREVLIRTLQY